MTSNLKVNNILPSTGTTVAVSGIASVTSSVSIASSCTATTFYGSGANLTSLPSQVTITDNANNRIITGGSGTNLVGEANLTWDGATLSASGGDAQLRLYDTTTSGSQTAVRIMAYNGVTHFQSGTAFSSDSKAPIIFGSMFGGTEWVRIDTSGRLLINTTAVSNTHDQLTVKRAASSFGEMSMSVDANTSTSSAANAFIFTKSKHTYWNGYGFQSSHGHIGAIVGKRDSTGGDSDQEIRIEIGGTHINQSEEKTWNFKNNGDLSISDGNLVVASGHGVDFSATSNSSGTMTSELLDQYEEGTFTPTIYRSNNSGVSGNYNYQHGVYTRIGRLVHCYIDVDINNFSGGGGHVAMGGLPFTVNSYGLPGWPHSMHMARCYTDGDYAAGVDAKSIRFTGSNYGYVMNQDDDQWDYGNYSRVIFTGQFTFMVT